MSQAADPSSASKTASKNIPDGIAKGILGFALGAGVTFLAMHFIGPREQVVGTLPMSSTSPMPASGSPPISGGPSRAMGSPSGGMGAAGKRNLTALVGKLELLSRDNLNLHLTFDQEQAQKISAELANLEAAKTLTDEEAQSRLEALQASLTPEQKETVDAIGWPRPAGGGGPGAGGGMGAAAADANPFAQETNENRLTELLGRLKSAASENRKTSTE